MATTGGSVMTVSKLVATLVVPAALLLGACTADDDTTSDTSNDSDVDQGLGSQDAAADVKLVSFTGPDAIGMWTATVEVTNNSSKTSDYYIEANVENQAGTVTDFTNGLVNKLQPGAKATVELVPVQASVGSTVVVTEVQRTAS